MTCRTTDSMIVRSISSFETSARCWVETTTVSTRAGFPR